MDNDKILELLMDIQQRLAKVEANTTSLTATDEKVEKSLAKSIENEHNIARLTTLTYWLYGIFFGTSVISIGIYIIEKFL